MALTPTINTNKGLAFTVARANTSSLRANKALTLGVLNFATQEVRANQTAVMVPVRASHDMHANMAKVLVVAKGRIAHPNMLVWTFTLDEHEMLVIQLQTETLVYDFAVEQWYTWGSGIEAGKFNVQVGCNWNADLGAILSQLGGTRMSNIVCGDDTTGALYFMDPELPEDYSSVGAPNKSFSRVITGQLVVRGHNYVSVPVVELTGSNGEEDALTDNTVTLTISDDQGHTYWSAGTQSVISGEYDVHVMWMGLGSFTGPGRLFRFTDYGAVARVDGLDIPGDA